MEVRFIDESDFANKGNGFIFLRDCSDWELDSTISLKLTDLLDDISFFHEISISVLEPWQEETSNS